VEWVAYGICSNLASSGEPPTLLHVTTLTTGNILCKLINVMVSAVVYSIVYS